MSCYDLIKGEGHVQNGTASYWLVFFTQVGHMIIVCFDWLWLVRMGCMTTTICNAVFNFIVFIRWYYLWRKQGYSLIRVFDNIHMGSYCPFVIKFGNMRGVNSPKFGGTRGVPFMDNNPWDWIILAMNAGCLLFILFSSSWIDCLNPLC